MDRNQPPTSAPHSRLILVSCPNCTSHKAIVAATHYGEHLCEHVWDCDDMMIPRRPSR